MTFNDYLLLFGGMSLATYPVYQENAEAGD